MAQGIVLQGLDVTYYIIPNILLNDKNTAYICPMIGNAYFIHAHVNPLSNPLFHITVKSEDKALIFNIYVELDGRYQQSRIYAFNQTYMGDISISIQHSNNNKMRIF
jgi:hypothetical protein